MDPLTYNWKDILLSFCACKVLILVHTKPMYSISKLVASWKNACILHDTGLKFCQATVKRVREKSRGCQNHKPQPFPDPKRKRKPTNLNKHKPEQTYEKH